VTGEVDGSSGRGASHAVSEEEQRQIFDDVARRYDGRWMRSRWPRNVNRRVDLVASVLGGALDNGPVVELGCGTGQMAELLLERRPQLRWTGLDLSTDMLAVAATRLARFGDRVETQAVEGRLRLEEGRFACGFGVDVLHHTEDAVGTLRDLRHGLRPGAPVVFLEGNPRFPVTTALGLLQRHERGLLRISVRSLTEWLQAAGFTSVRAFYGPTYTPPAPGRVAAALDRVDLTLARVPLLRTLALHVVAVGHA
jgi:SAM-dependent methyltransferase